METSIGTMLKNVPPERQDKMRRLRDVGGTSIGQFSNAIRDTMMPGDAGLVIFEDRKVKAIDFGTRIGKITTWSFLVGLERLGVIPSADSIHEDMAKANRTISRDPFERKPIAIEPGMNWTDSYDMSDAVTVPAIKPSGESNGPSM